MKKHLPVIVCFCFTLSAFCQTAVTFTVNTANGRKAISPLVYGINHTTDFSVYGTPEAYGSYRLGGNRLTGYNWENNASNAGSDYIHNSDDYLCYIFNLTSSQCTTPAGVFTKFKQLSGPAYPVVTLPLAGYVAADKAGPVSSAETAPSARWKQIVHAKGSAFSLTPDLTDGAVYSDEAVNYLVTTLGTAAGGGIRGYSLDNEPGLWSSTHPRIHSAAAGAAELAAKSKALAKAVKSVDQTAETFGGVFYGFGDYYNLQNAPDWPSVQGSYSWYIDYFLDQMKGESTAYGKRLLDVLDVHWYPEAIGDQRITNSSANSTADKQARMQAPRTLWDPAYRENSYIAQYFSSYLPLLPRIKASVNQYYPGTKTGLSEYNYGGGGDVSGGIAQADVLGIFGKYDVYSAQLWPLNSTVSYFQSAFRIYRNYNGAGRGIGDTYVQSSTSDSINTSVYASIDGTSDSTLHLVVINKAPGTVNGSFNLNGAYNTAEVWQFNGSSTVISKVAQPPVSGTTFTYALAPLTVTHLVLRKSIALPLTLKSFAIKRRAGLPQLQWRTATESGMKDFTAMRSCDGLQWEPVGTLPAQNNAAGSTYVLDDRTVDLCNGSTIHYRLKMTAQTGEATYSREVLFTAQTASSLTLYPNPAGDVLVLTGLKEKAGDVLLTTGEGQVVKKVSTNGAKQLTIQIHSLAGGVYRVEVRYQNGEAEGAGFVKTK